MMDGPGTYPPPPTESVMANAGDAAMVSAKTDATVAKRIDCLDFRKDIFSLLLIGIVPNGRLRWRIRSGFFYFEQITSEEFDRL